MIADSALRSRFGRLGVLVVCGCLRVLGGPTGGPNPQGFVWAPAKIRGLAVPFPLSLRYTSAGSAKSLQIPAPSTSTTVLIMNSPGSAAPVSADRRFT